MDINDDIITFILIYLGLELPILLTSSKLPPWLLKQPLKAQKKLKELEIM